MNTLAVLAARSQVHSTDGICIYYWKISNLTCVSLCDIKNNLYKALNFNLQTLMHMLKINVKTMFAVPLQKN